MSSGKDIERRGTGKDRRILSGTIFGRRDRLITVAEYPFEFVNGVRVYHHTVPTFLDFLQNDHYQRRLFDTITNGGEIGRRNYAIVNKDGIHRLDLQFRTGGNSNRQASDVEAQIGRISRDKELYRAKGLVDVNNVGHIVRTYHDPRDSSRAVLAWAEDVITEVAHLESEGKTGIKLGQTSFAENARAQTLFMYRVGTNTLLTTTPPGTTPEQVNAFLAANFGNQEILNVRYKNDINVGELEAIRTAMRQGMI